MTYNEVFGGGSINPAQRTYLSLVTAVDVALQWPIEQQIAGANVAADIIDIEATAPGLNVDFDDAQIVSNGFTSLMTNVGAQTVTIRDSAGGTIISLAPGEAWFIYLTDNTTAAGTWRTFQLGATVSVANASALAGAGLKAIATTLNQTIPPTLTAVTPINWVDADRAQFTIWTGGVGVLNLPTAATVGSDWFSIARNEGTGDLTITPPAGTIDSATTLVMAPGESAIIVTDGTNFFTIGLGQSTSGTFDFVQIDVSGSGNFNLSGVQLNRIAYRFIGALTGNRNIIVPNTVQQYWVDNSTTGAFSLFVQTAAQITPVEVLQNNRSILYCDGTDVIDAETGTLTPPISIGQGGTGALNAVDAMANLGVGRNVNTAALSGLAGGGDLSADRNFVLDTDNLTTELTVDLAADTIAFYDDDVAAMRKTPLSNIAAITVQEEGVTVPPLASTLNFTGGAITASGAGAVKTIDVPIAAPTPADSVLRADGSDWVIPPNITIDSIGRLILTQTPFIDATAQFRASAGNFLGISAFGQFGNLSVSGTVTDISLNAPTRVQGGFYALEQGAPSANQAGYLQLHAESGAQPHFRYTDDAGLELPICEEGNFTVDFDVGFGEANVVTIQYIRIGNMVHITMPVANFGNSNAATFGTGNDWLAALRPDSNRYGSTICTEDGAEQVLAAFFLNSSGALTFLAPNAGDAGDYGNNWVASGVKGVNAGWSWSYRITDS